MKRKVTTILMLILLTLTNISHVAAQKQPMRYEVEIMRNVGKDTREFNSNLSFGEDSLKIVSSRKDTVFAEMKYTEIQSAEYSFAKKPLLGKTKSLILGAFFPLTTVALLFVKKKIHWLTIRTNDDFAVLKLEGDNYRQIKSELETRNIKVEIVKE